MVSTFPISEEDYPALENLIHLSDQDFRRLAEAIDEAPLVAHPRRFARAVADKVEGIPRDVTVDIVVLLHLFCDLIRAGDLTPVALAHLVREALEESGRDELRPAGGDWSAFQKRLSDLLSLESLRLDAKAFRLYVSEERTYHDVSIVTNIRPVFKDNPDERLAGALVLHTLILEYHEEGIVESVKVLLDREGLDDLRQALNRAESKAKNLKQLFASANVPVLREESS